MRATFSSAARLPFPGTAAPVAPLRAAAAAWTASRSLAPRACAAASSGASLVPLLRRPLSTTTTTPPPWSRHPALDVPHPHNNVPESIKERVGRGLLLRPTHPLGRLKSAVEAHFADPSAVSRPLVCFDSLDPVVTARQNFDDLLTPADHVSRSPTDTFYVDDARLLRCHMTAHQTSLLRDGHRAFLMAGDVFRRDTVDATHYPVFHQIDGVRVFDDAELPPAARCDLDVVGGRRSPAAQAAASAFVMRDLRGSLEGLARVLFGKDAQTRWVEAYFPFTEPSLELEIFFEGQWLEVLGCGQIRGGILESTQTPPGSVGWAFGMGVERLAMAMYGIPDIRLFWSEDRRFLDQFRGSGGVGVGARAPKFVPFSKYPACYKDVAFWADDNAADPSKGKAAGSRPPFHENDFFAVVREACGDLCESATLVDTFSNPKTGRTSRCYRLLYRAMDRNLTNEEVDAVQDKFRKRLVDDLGVTLR
jgi:phenylalanyl-tRNA synthetase alpha chain